MLSTQARTSSGPGLAAAPWPGSTCLPVGVIVAAVKWSVVGREDVCPALSAQLRYFLSIPACNGNAILTKRFYLHFFLSNFLSPRDFLRVKHHHCYHHCQCCFNIIIGHSHFELFFDGLVKRLQFGGASIWDDRQAGVALVVGWYIWYNWHIWHIWYIWYIFD